MTIASPQTNEENEDCFGVIVATRRLASFYKITDLSGYKLSVEFGELLEAGVSNECCEGILENVITCLRLEIMWGVHALQGSSTTPDRVSVHAGVCLYIYMSICDRTNHSISEHLHKYVLRQHLIVCMVGWVKRTTCHP